MFSFLTSVTVLEIITHPLQNVWKLSALLATLFNSCACFGIFSFLGFFLLFG